MSTASAPIAAPDAPLQADVDPTRDELRATTERLTRLLASLGGGVLVEDESRRIILANQTFCDIFAIPVAPELLVGLDCAGSAEQSKHLFADPAAFGPRIAELLAAREQVLAEEITLADGSVFVRDYVPIEIEGSNRGHLWHYRDVTARRAAERAAHASDARANAAITAALDSVISIDLTGRVVEFNPAAEHTFGYTRSDAIGRQLAELIVPERFREVLRNGLERYAETGTSRIVGRRIEIIAMRADGSELPVELAIADVTHHDPPLLTAYLRDISERLDAEREREYLLRREQVARHEAESAREELADQNQQLRELDAVKDELVARVSHELRTPLASIISFVQLALDSEIGAEAHRFLTVADRNAARLVGLVEDLLLLARADAGRLTIELVSLDAATVVRDSVTAIAPVAAAKGVSVSASAPVLVPVEADRIRIYQVLDNLLGNAVKFTPSGGSVVARAQVVLGRVRIEVEDDGPGISEDDQRRIFERFARGANARGAESPGAGLGLAIVRTIVEAHGGTVSIRSVEGAGTTVQVELPLALS